MKEPIIRDGDHSIFVLGLLLSIFSSGFFVMLAARFIGAWAIIPYPFLVMFGYGRIVIYLKRELYGQ